MQISYVIVLFTQILLQQPYQSWPPIVIKGDNWETLYSKQLGNLEVLQTVGDAIAWANNLIHTIENS